jgi:hypothetical protein
MGLRVRKEIFGRQEKEERLANRKKQWFIGKLLDRSNGGTDMARNGPAGRPISGTRVFSYKRAFLM